MKSRDVQKTTAKTKKICEYSDITLTLNKIDGIIKRENIEAIKKELVFGEVLRSKNQSRKENYE